MNNDYRNVPIYPDDSDYTTNSPSYYDELARKQKLIQLLTEKIWKYDDEIKEYFKRWEDNLANINREVIEMMIQWLEDGTLDHIINDTIFNWKADKTMVEQIAILPQTFGAKADGIADDTLAIKETIDYAKQHGYSINFGGKKNHYRISEKIIVTGLKQTNFYAQGALLDFTPVPYEQKRDNKLVFKDCFGVNIYGFEIVDYCFEFSDEGQAGAVVIIEQSCENTDFYKNYVHGVNSNMVKGLMGTGIGFYSRNGNCYENKFVNSYGFGVINILWDENSQINVFKNTVINANYSYEVAYNCVNVNLVNNVSIHPRTGHFFLPVMISANLNENENTYKNKIKNIFISKNLCISDPTLYTRGVIIRSYGGPNLTIEHITIENNYFKDTHTMLSISGGSLRSINNIIVHKNIIESNITKRNVIGNGTTDLLMNISIQSFEPAKLFNLVFNKNTIIGNVEGFERLGYINSANNQLENVEITNNKIINGGYASRTKIFDLINGKKTLIKGNTFMDNKQELTFNISKSEMDVIDNKGIWAITDTLNESIIKLVNNKGYAFSQFKDIKLTSNTSFINRDETSRSIPNPKGVEFNTSLVLFNLNEQDDYGRSWVNVTNETITFNISNPLPKDVSFSYTIIEI